MSLTGRPLVGLLLVLAVAVPLLLALAMWRMSRGWGRALVAIVGVLVCQAVAIGAAGVVANNQFGFYNSWKDLLGQGDGTPQDPTTNGLLPANHSQGRLVTLTVLLPPHGRARVGRASMSVLVWLPKEYGQPQYRTTKFPVVMMMPGQPGTPQAVFRQFRFGPQFTQAIASHQVKPFVAVFPPIMIAPPRDTECTNVPRGPQAETWLFRNVRNAVLHSIRVTPNGRQWSAMGWSTGGFCAAKLLLRHPTLFHAAVGFGAYYDAETDKTTGDLFGGSQKLRNENSPIWLIQRPRREPVRLLIIASRRDRASYNGRSYADTRQMIEVSRGTPGVATLVLPRGGHNYHVYRATVPQALTWLAHNGAL